MKMVLFSFVLLQAVLLFSSPEKLPFAFLGVSTDHQPDIATKLKAKIIEKLENIRKLDHLSGKEIKDLQVKTILSDKVPTNDEEARNIFNNLGAILLSSAYLRKITHKTSNNFWPPFSVNVNFLAEMELEIFECSKNKLLFSGIVKGSAYHTRLFTLNTSTYDKGFLDAVDRDKVVNNLIIDMAEKVAKIIKQITSDSSITE